MDGEDDETRRAGPLDPDVATSLAAQVRPGTLARAALRRELAGADEVLRAQGDGADQLAARALLHFGATPPRLRDGLRLALAARARARPGQQVEHLDIALQAAVVLADDDAMDALLDGSTPLDPWVAWAARTDRARRAGDVHGWWASLNAPLLEHGLEPVHLAPGHGPAFDRLACDVVGAVDEGPLVSVVVSVHRPGPSFEPALRSLLGQTWRRLEVLLVDDANDEAGSRRIQELAATDGRVRVLRQEVNGGTYRARNRALAEARGELFGVQDADDWMHPRRIERQVRRLQESPSLVATASRAVRVHDDLSITRVGAPPFTLNLPSLLVRLQPLRERLGGFDPVRKAADLELERRLAAVFGDDAVETLEQPLTFYQLSGGSLSRADFRLSWHHPARHAYHSAFARWHRRASTHELRLDPEAPRRFLAPEHVGGPPVGEALDVVVWADLRESGPGGRVAAELERLAATGVGVGVLGGEPARRASRRREDPAGRVLDLVGREVVQWVDHTRERTVPTVLVRDPELLVLPPATPSWHLRARRVVVAAAVAPSSADGRAVYAARDVDRAARVLLGADEVVWWPEDEQVEHALRASGVVTATAAGPFEVLGPVRPPQPVVGSAVLGLVGAAARRPTVPLGVDARVLGRGRVPGWAVVDERVVGRRAFLRTCDAVLLLDGASPQDRRSLVLDALEEGVVPIEERELSSAAWLVDAAEREAVWRDRLGAARRLHAGDWADRLAGRLRP